LHALQKETFEFPAINRTFGINPAATPFKGCARLREASGAANAPLARDKETKLFQFGGDIARLKLDVSKDNPVTAKAAFEAKRITFIQASRAYGRSGVTATK